MSESSDSAEERRWTIKRNQIVPHWCPLHRGFPPIFDLSMYECPKCGRYVCGACLFVTKEGVLCAECVKDIKDNDIRPFYDEKLVSEKRRLYAKILFIVFAPIYFLPIVGIYLAYFVPSFRAHLEMLSYLLAILFVLGTIFLVCAYFAIFQKKKNGPELDISELKKLDQEIAESVKKGTNS